MKGVFEARGTLQRAKQAKILPPGAHCVVLVFRRPLSLLASSQGCWTHGQASPSRTWRGTEGLDKGVLPPALVPCGATLTLSFSFLSLFCGLNVFVRPNSHVQVQPSVFNVTVFGGRVQGL